MQQISDRHWLESEAFITATSDVAITGISKIRIMMTFQNEYEKLFFEMIVPLTSKIIRNDWQAILPFIEWEAYPNTLI